MRKIVNENVWVLLLGALLSAACTVQDETTDDLAAGSEPETSSGALEISTGQERVLYSGLYFRNWSTDDGLRTQWSDLVVNNPNDAPALVKIRIHKVTGGVPHAEVQQTIPAHGAWSSFGQPAWVNIPFTHPDYAVPAKSASTGWIEVGSHLPVIATQRLTMRTGNTYNSPVALFQDEVLGPEVSGTLYSTLYLKNWPTGDASGRTQWSNLVIVNPGYSAANVTIQVYKVDGTGPLGNSLTQSIAPGAAFKTDGLPAWLNMPDASPHVGWVQVTSDRPVFGINRFTIRNGTTYNAPIALFQTEAMSGMVDTHLGTSLLVKNWPLGDSTTRRQWSNVTVVNPGAWAATATIRIYRANGTELKTFTKIVPAHGWWNSYGDADWNAVPNTDATVGGALGWVVVTSSLPIFGMNRKRILDGSTLVSLDDESLTRPLPSSGYASLYLKNWPHDGGNTQWSRPFVSNPQPSATTITLSVYGMDGAPLKTFQRNLPPFGWWSAYGDPDWLAVPATASFPTGPATLGWTELISSQPVRATNRVTVHSGTTYNAPIVHLDDIELVTTQP